MKVMKMRRTITTKMMSTSTITSRVMERKAKRWWRKILALSNRRRVLPRASSTLEILNHLILYMSARSTRLCPYILDKKQSHTESIAHTKSLVQRWTCRRLHKREHTTLLT
jgi:hypothetical protein